MRSHPICLAVVCLLVCGASSKLLLAQTVPYNPYAPEPKDVVAVTPDGKINWPTFYRSVGLHNKFQTYFQMGSCAGTKQSIVDMLGKNKVDINALGERTITGRVATVSAGTLTAREASGQAMTVVLHPAGVSHVEVDGYLPAARLSPGMTVRFTGSVNEHGLGAEKVHALNVFTLDAEHRPNEVEPGRVQTIVGQVRKLHGSRLEIVAESGEVHRLTFLLADDCEVRVTAQQPQLISPGDEIVAKGHVYSGEKGAGSVLFANRLEVTTNYQVPSQIENATVAK